MAHDAEKHAPGLFGRAGALKCLLKFGHVLGCLFSLNDGPPKFVSFVFNDEDMEETVADEATECIIRPERPENLKDNGDCHREAEQEDHQISSPHGVPTAIGLHKSAHRHQNI